jgi:hypothetical protein
MGGGMPIFMDDQNVPRSGLVGCLVSDGTYFYALTSRHVVGEPGTAVYTFRGGEREVIGTSHSQGALKFPLQGLYPGFAGSKCEVTLGRGLVRIEEPHAWTCQVAGVGQLGEPIDVSADYDEP